MKITLYLKIFTFALSTSMTAQAFADVPVKDETHIERKKFEWYLKDIPWSALFNQENIESLAGLREFMPQRYAELMAFLEDEMAEDFSVLVGQVNSAERVYSYNEETDTIYHNSLNEWIKVAVMSEKSYNAASETQNQYIELASKFLETFSAADREVALINASTETAQSLQTLIKILAQKARAEATTETEEFHQREINEKATVDKNGQNEIGCNKNIDREQYFNCSIRNLENMNTAEQNKLSISSSSPYVKKITKQ